MGTQAIVQKLWNLCNVLRDDGITYHQYVTELTYILFLKMANETGVEDKLFVKKKEEEEDDEDKEKKDKQDINLSENHTWDELTKRDGIDLYNYYKQLLLDLGKFGRDKVKQIYTDASTNIAAPKNLESIIKAIHKLDWYSAKEEGLGDLYEGLLEKNAGEKKSGAGQYFTPRPLINVMVRLMDPQVGERCNDPAAGTFGFMIAADRHVRQKTNDYFKLNDKEIEFQKKEAFSGCELVRDTHRLAMMNAMLHNIEGQLLHGDTLSSKGESFIDYDVILTNPPFGTKKGGERPTRSDLTIKSSNKQLNFLQHIYRSLKQDGKARAAVVLPDNVLFQDGDGRKVREDLLNKCKLDTVLRLPTGIFYSQGVKTNVIFFSRGKTDKGNTKEVFYYDLRTNMENLGKTNPLRESHFKEFEETYHSSKEEKLKLERWSHFTLEEIKTKSYSLDLGLIKDDAHLSHEDLPDPIESTEVAIAKLEQASDLLAQVVRELKLCEADG